MSQQSAHSRASLHFFSNDWAARQGDPSDRFVTILDVLESSRPNAEPTRLEPVVFALCS